MIIWGGAAFGAIIGSFTAQRRGGNKLDIAQYAAGYALAFAIVGTICVVILQRVGV